MVLKTSKEQHIFEVFLVLITAALTCLLYKTAGYKMVVLNLYFLPVVLAAFFLGRYRAGVLALLSVIAASVVTALSLTDFATISSPIVIGLAVTVWGAVLGLTAILVGTLSDERSTKMVELHEAHVGVVEVLSRYLQSANPRLKDRSNRVAEMSRQVAMQMKLSTKEADDIRVAALLYDLENIEITARVIRNAMGQLGDEPATTNPEQHTFHGTELVHSLRSVLTGAFPLLVNLNHTTTLGPRAANAARTDGVPFGARIIQTVRSYDELIHSDWGTAALTPAEVIDELRLEPEADHHPAVLDALERTLELTAPARTSITTAVPATAPTAEPVSV
jgi:hypothetical protein